MTPNEYQEQAMRSEADQMVVWRRLKELGMPAIRLDNAARGLAEDAGEISGAVKRHIEYGQPLDRTNLLEEVGDCLWRLAQVCKAGEFTLEQAMQANLRKLRQRYPDGYSDDRAAEQARDRVAERDALCHLASADVDAQTRIQSDLDTAEAAKLYYDHTLEQTGQGWAEPPEDQRRTGWDVARDLVGWLDGQDYERARKYVEEQEKLYA